MGEQQKKTVFSFPRLEWDRYSAIVCGSLLVVVTTGAVLFFSHERIIIPPVKDVVTPLVLGCASLIVSLGSWNMSISDRARANAKLLIEGGLDEKRRGNLRTQNTIFRERYTFNQFALGFQFVSLATFLVMAVANASGLMGWTRFCFLFGSVLLVCGFLLTLFDIYRSQETLFLEIGFADTVEGRKRCQRNE